MAEKITAADMRQAIMKTYAAPEWAVMWEVALTTGAVAGKQRYADAVMMSLWPSRGLEMHGVEIKVSRSDWKREAADPTKAEAIAAYCDRWWVFVGPGVIHDVAEIPPNWGVREWDGKRWKTLQDAAQNKDVATCDRRFLASLLRRGDEAERRRIDAEVRKAVDAAREEIDRRVKSEVEQRSRDSQQAVDWVNKFGDVTGIDLRAGWYSSFKDAKEVGAAVNLVLDTGFEGVYSNVRSVAASMNKAAATVQAAIERYDARRAAARDEVEDLLS